MQYVKHHTRCDSVLLQYKGTTVLDFYLNVSKCHTAAYIYITTAEEAQSQRNITDGARCTVGVVTKGTPLATLINTFKGKLQTYLK